MKKLLALFLLISFALALCGCDVMFSSEKESQETPEETEEVSFEAENVPVEEDVPEVSEEVEEESEISIEILPGTAAGSVYENPSLGYGCSLEEEWYFYSKEEMDEMNQLSLDAFDDAQIREQLSSVDMFYDMMAQPEDGSAMLQVAVENVGRIYGDAVSLDEYIEITTENLPDTLTSAGYTNCVSSTEQVQFAGEEMTAIVISGELQEIAVYQRMVPIKYGNQMAIFASASFVDDYTSDLLNLFYLLP